MAFIERDTLIVPRMKLAGMTGIHNKFAKAWPKTTTSDGVEVYQSRMYFYRAKEWIHEKKMDRFFNAVGIDKEELYGQKIDKEIDDMWFYLDGSQFTWDGSYAGDSRVNSSTTDIDTTPIRRDIVEAFNEALVIGEEYEVTVQYGGPTKRYLSSHGLEWYLTDIGTIENSGIATPAIKAQIESDPWFYLANARNIADGKTEQFQLYDGGNIDIPHTSLKPNNRLTGACLVSAKPVSDVKKPYGPMYDLALFAPMGLLDNTFSRIDESYTEQLGTVNSSKSSVEYGTGEILLNNFDGEVLTYTYTYKYVYNGIKEDSPLVTHILDFYNTQEKFSLKRRKNPHNPSAKWNYLSATMKDNAYKKILTQLKTYVDPYTGIIVRGYTDELWYRGSLRVDTAAKMRRSDFVTMFAACVDTDYKVEEAKWWEKVLAVVIIIIAIVVFIYTLGAGTGMMGIVAAQAAGYAGMVISIGAMLLSYFGGLSAMPLVELLGDIAQIVGYIAMIAGIYAMIQNAGKILAEQALKEAGKEITQEAIKQEMLTQTLIDQVSAFAEQALGSITEFATQSITDIISGIMDSIEMAFKLLEFQQDGEMKELEAEYERLKEEEEKYNIQILNDNLKDIAAVYYLAQERAGTYDAITIINNGIESTVGSDANFTAFYNSTNSV